MPIDVFEVRDDELTAGSGRARQITVGDRSIFFGMGESVQTSIAVVDRKTHAVVKRVTPESAPIDTPVRTTGGAIAHWHKYPYGIAFINDDGAVEKLHTIESGYLGSIEVDPKHDTVVWALGEGLRYSLWAASAARRAEDFRPRLVTTYELASGYVPVTPIVNEGYALVLESELRALLVRLSDGKRWAIAPEPEDRWTSAAFITSMEIGLVVGSRAGLGTASSESLSIVRLPIDGLGPSLP